MYADLDVWLWLLTEGEQDAVERFLENYAGELELSLVTFVELFLVEETYPFDREQAVTAMLELASYDGDPGVLYRASAHRERGLDTFEAFHAALARDAIVSRSEAYDRAGIERIPLEEAT